MKEPVKHILRFAGIYHPLQMTYFLLKRSLIASYRRVAYASKKGEGFTCNCCAASYREFAPWYPQKINAHAIESNGVVAGYGKNIICPRCGSTARERLVIEMLKLHFSVQGKKVLLVSPEEKVAGYLKGRCHLITGDLQPGYYKHIDPGVMKLDLLNLPFEDGFFDLVIANHVMEHIPDDIRAIKEVFRVLKQGGRAVLQVPFSETISNSIEEEVPLSPEKRSERFGQRDHVRIYLLQDYLDRLRNCGFRVDILRYSELSNCNEYAIQRGEHFLMIEKPSIS